MKKQIICALTFIILLFTNFSMAKTQHSEVITAIEKSLLGVEYTNQSDIKRVERLENEIYGQVSKGSLTSRIAKLSKDLNAEMFGQEIKPKKDTFDEEEDYFEKREKADASVNYPIIDELETKIFNKNFKNNGIEKRLENLEKKVFSKSFNNEDLNTRTERLKIAVLPKQKNNFETEDVINLAQEDIDNFSKKNPLNFFSGKKYEKYPEPENNYNYDTASEDINLPLAQLEKQILKHTYKNDAPSTRLVRLETKLFSTTFTQDDTQTRLDRISSAYQASKTSKRYDDNKFAQRMATAMQIGAFVLMILATIL